MRKIPEELENPIDSALLTIIHEIQPFFYELGFTPNILTTLSLLFWLGGLYFFVNNGTYYAYYAVILMFISYFFDCFDGHFARSYDMVTTFGDYYDHVSDLLKYVLLIYFIIVKHSSSIFIVFPILCVFMILMCMHLSCQELYYGVPSDTLSILNCLCIATEENVNDVMNITKYFGCGTFHLVIFLCVLYLKETGNK